MAAPTNPWAAARKGARPGLAAGREAAKRMRSTLKTSSAAEAGASLISSSNLEIAAAAAAIVVPCLKKVLT